jgi:uncharacterized repeat protein (TIGR01451 family)
MFTRAGGAEASCIARWNGSNWSALGSGVGPAGPKTVVSGLAVAGADLYAGGGFATAGGKPASAIARWDGADWHPLGSGIEGSVFAVATAGRALAAGGSFALAGGKVSAGFAVYQPRVNVSEALMEAAPGPMVVGNDAYGFHKPALMIGDGVPVVCPGGLPTTVTLDQAPLIAARGSRVNGAFLLSPDGLQFGGAGALLRVEFSDMDAAAFAASPSEFRAVRITHADDYPATTEARSLELLGDEHPTPIRVDNGRQIYAVTVPVSSIGGIYGAVPRSLLSADLAVTQTASKASASVGESVSFTVTVRNLGPNAATDVEAADALPPQFELTTASVSQGTVKMDAGVVRARLGTIAAGAAAILKVDCVAVEEGDNANVGTASSPQPDPDMANNTASAQVAVAAEPPGPDLCVEWQGLSRNAQGTGFRRQCSLRGVLRVRDDGTSPVRSTTAALYVSDDARHDASDRLLRSVSVGRLSPGQARDVPVWVRLPAGVDVSGKRVIAVIDPSNRVAESDETNNAAVFGPVM